MKPPVDELVDQNSLHHHYQGFHAVLPCRAAVVPQDPQVRGRDHPPPPDLDRVAVAEAEPRAAGPAVLAYLRKGETFAGLAARFGVGTATPELYAAIHAGGLNALDSVAYWQRDNQFAHQCYDQALRLCQEERAAAGIALSQNNLGFTAAAAGDYRSALRRFGAALTEYEALEDQLGASNALAGLALVDRATGAYQRGQQRAAQALTQQRHLGDAFAIANTLSLLGSITTQLGHLTEAEAMLREALVLHDQAGNASGITWMLRELAAAAAIHGQRQRAVQLSSAAESLEDQLGGGIPLQMLGITPLVDAAMEQLGALPAQQAWRQGQEMNQQEAVAFALSSG
jgi:tetratricopeptide (TPR) repeat protein